MKQRIVLKVDMSDSEKKRMKAMKIASGTRGVVSVSVQGQNDQLVVLGEGIDTAELTREIRKKIGDTSIITVQAAPQQQQSQSYGQYNEMSQVRKCMCEIPQSGYCGFCRSMNQNQYQMVVHQPYSPPVTYGGYGGYREEPDGCIIM